MQSEATDIESAGQAPDDGRRWHHVSDTALAGYDTIVALARVAEERGADPCDAHCARSLTAAWSCRESLSVRQWRMVRVLVAKANASADYVPVPALGTWWHDCSPDAQSRRGVKRGCVVRARNRQRDRAIEYAVNACGQTVRAVAARFGLAASTVSRIASGARFWKPRKVLGLLPLPFKKVQTKRASVRNVPHAYLPDPGLPREVGLFRALARWLALETVRPLPDAAKYAEAEWLNSQLARPMKAERVRTIARPAICARR